jgi:hypothetical protein
MQQLINFDCLEELDDFGAVRWQRMPGKEIRHSSEARRCPRVPFVEHLCSSLARLNADTVKNTLRLRSFHSDQETSSISEARPLIPDLGTRSLAPCHQDSMSSSSGR